MSDYTVVVAMANPQNVPSLMTLGCMMAQEFDGRVVGVTVVQMDYAAPDPDPECHDRMSRAYDILSAAEEIAEKRNVEFDGRLAVGREVHEILDDVAEAERAKLIIVGYSERQHPRGDDSDFDRLIDEIAAHAPCDLAVARMRTPLKLDRVLVPVRTALNLDVRRDFVTAMHHVFGSEVDLIHFACSEEEVERLHDELEQWLIHRGVWDWVHLMVDVHDDPAQAIVDVSPKYDAVVLGTSPLHEVRRKYFGAVPEYVASHAKCSTFLLRTADVRA